MSSYMTLFALKSDQFHWRPYEDYLVVDFSENNLMMRLPPYTCSILSSAIQANGVCPPMRWRGRSVFVVAHNFVARRSTFSLVFISGPDSSVVCSPDTLSLLELNTLTCGSSHHRTFALWRLHQHHWEYLHSFWDIPFMKTHNHMNLASGLLMKWNLLTQVFSSPKSFGFVNGWCNEPVSSVIIDLLSFHWTQTFRGKSTLKCGSFGQNIYQKIMLFSKNR